METVMIINNQLGFEVIRGVFHDLAVIYSQILKAEPTVNKSQQNLGAFGDSQNEFFGKE